MARKLKILSKSATSKSFKLNLSVHGIKGLLIDGVKQEDNYSFNLQIRWRGSRTRGRCRSKSIRNMTAERSVQRDGSVNWEESFDHVCKMKLLSIRSFSNWDIHLEIHGFASDSGSRTSILGNVTVDIAEFLTPNTSERTIQIPVNCNLGCVTVEAELTMTLSLCEIPTKTSTMKKRVLSLLFPSGSCRDLPQIDNKAQVMIPQHSKPSETVEADKQAESEYDGISECKFTPEQSKKFTTTESSSSPSSSSSSTEDPEFGYGSIAVTNLLVALHSKDQEGDKVELRKESLPTTDHEIVQRPSSLFSLLQWKNSSFRGSHRHKGTPLLNKYCKEGGDDIDNDRRNQPSLQPDSPGPRNTQKRTTSLASGFDNEDCFKIGCWEKKEIVSRDGRWELHTDTFLASIDQCSEKVGGEGACAVIVTVIADWLHRNQETLPLKCQFDKLIREGSLEWRKICENESLMEKFSDKHFDLDTVLAAKVRPLSVVSAYVGFFVPDDMTETFDFLDGLKSFDSIWDEHVSNVGPEGGVYIVSWNDHFFTIKVEREAIYLIDTLGERLHEGCNQAYILKFGNETTIYELQPKLSNLVTESPDATETSTSNREKGQNASFTGEVLCQGRSSCKAFIKNFWAALPLRELQDDMQKGLITKEQLHRRLQIEFHYAAISD